MTLNALIAHLEKLREIHGGEVNIEYFNHYKQETIDVEADDISWVEGLGTIHFP